MGISPHELPDDTGPRLMEPPAGLLRSLLWMGPSLMLLGAAIGSGELVAEPAAGAKYGGSLFWAILLIVATKAFWNEAIGRVGLVTGQNFLESCTAAGPVTVSVPWLWYAVNALKDFFLRGGIVGIAGYICLETFPPLPVALTELIPWSDDISPVDRQAFTWALLNYLLIWALIAAGGYRLAELLNTGMCLLFTACLTACAVSVLPQAMHELTAGLVPRPVKGAAELMMLVSLAGIVMSGSTTVYYSAWAEERGMGLFAFKKRTGGRVSRQEIEPKSEQEIRQMRGWLRVNTLNVGITYALGALICLSTFVLGIAVLRPAGVTLEGAKLVRELSLMMTSVAGPWTRPVFYLGAYAAVMSTAIGILDGGSRMYLQPVRRTFPRFSPALGQKLIMTLMVLGSWLVFVWFRDALMLIVWMGIVDAPLVGILMLTYAYLCRSYLPQAYRMNIAWVVFMVMTGLLYLTLGGYFVCQKVFGS
ncbi:MAG: Nramp family divalent metal transporter [Pirellulaceae bacterium]|nr:Nramp family divalent metal transporter [Pirellulaceae bacterium]HJN12407.1 Nramp family divalent metal transporter [Pirellulaceae bacterium]